MNRSLEESRRDNARWAATLRFNGLLALQPDKRHAIDIFQHYGNEHGYASADGTTIPAFNKSRTFPLSSNDFNPSSHVHETASSVFGFP